MDPVANITRQRELAESILSLNGTLEIREPSKPTITLVGFAGELAELVQALDEWRRKGGFDPYSSATPTRDDIADWLQQSSDLAERVEALEAGDGVPATLQDQIDDIRRDLDQLDVRVGDLENEA